MLGTHIDIVQHDNRAEVERDFELEVRSWFNEREKDMNYIFKVSLRWASFASAFNSEAVYMEKIVTMVEHGETISAALMKGENWEKAMKQEVERLLRHIKISVCVMS